MIIELKLKAYSYIALDKKLIVSIYGIDDETSAIVLKNGKEFIIEGSYEIHKYLLVKNHSSINQIEETISEETISEEVEEAEIVNDENINIEKYVEPEIPVEIEPNMITLETLAKCLKKSVKDTKNILETKNKQVEDLLYGDVFQLLKENRLNKVKTIQWRNKKDFHTSYMTDWPYTEAYTIKLIDIAYEELYNAAREKYHFQCANCYTQDNLVIHHIDTNHANMVLSNLELLCDKCHREKHKLNGKQWNKKRPRNFKLNKLINFNK